MHTLTGYVVELREQDYVLSDTAVRTVRRHPRLQEFLNYVYSTYIGPTATFRPSMWNVHDRCMSLRTNNFVERSVYCRCTLM